MEPQWISAIASAVAAIGVLAVIYQARTGVAQLKTTVDQLNNSIVSLKADHERSRRSMAIDLLRHWDENLTLKGAVARKFAECLDFDQSKCLFGAKEFKAKGEHYELFLGTLPQRSAEERRGVTVDQKGDFEVSERESSEIRWAIISYLNHLETILAAVRHNVADKDMIYEQFTYLVSPSDGHYILEDFRRAAGGAETYPSIEAFANEIRNKHEVGAPGKGKVV